MNVSTGQGPAQVGRGDSNPRPTDYESAAAALRSLPEITDPCRPAQDYAGHSPAREPTPAAWVTFAAALACWILWRQAASTPSYDLFLQTLTVVALKSAFFALLPVPGLDGGEPLQNRPYSWLVTFTPWAQLVKATIVLLVAAVLSGLLWSYASRRAERLAAVTDEEEDTTSPAR